MKTLDFSIDGFVCECGNCWDEVPEDEYLKLQRCGLWPQGVIIKKEHRLPHEKVLIETGHLCIVKKVEENGTN